MIIRITESRIYVMFLVSFSNFNFILLRPFIYYLFQKISFMFLVFIRVMK
jgi:hypothetical protein